MSNNIDHKKKIQELINSQRVFIFIKGTADAPLCRFSVQAVELLKKHQVAFGFFNVMEDEEIREAIKDFSDWPTIPQLYVAGNFVGGADIMQELEDQGELGVVLA